MDCGGSRASLSLKMLLPLAASTGEAGVVLVIALLFGGYWVSTKTTSRRLLLPGSGKETAPCLRLLFAAPDGQREGDNADGDRTVQSVQSYLQLDVSRLSGPSAPPVLEVQFRELVLPLKFLLADDDTQFRAGEYSMVEAMDMAFIGSSSCSVSLSLLSHFFPVMGFQNEMEPPLVPVGVRARSLCSANGGTDDVFPASSSCIDV